MTSVIISSISFGAFGEDSGKNAGIFAESKSTAANETEDAIQTSDGDEETNLIDETETVVFEFTEELSNNSRMIGDGGEVGFGPPEDDSSTTLLITSPILPDGVYAIESVSAPGLWIDVNNVTGPGHIVWQDYHSRPTNSFNRIALFKIKYVPNTQSYIIRLMTNNMLTLGISELNDVVTKTISSPYDDQVLPSETFTITRTVNGYIIKQYGYSDKAIASRFDVGGETYYPDSNLMYNYITEAGDKAKWNFYKYTGADKHGMILSYSSSYTSIGIPVGTTGTMGIKTWSTVIGSNIPQMQAASDSTAMISTGNTSNVGEISFTALSPGYATIQSMIRNANSTTSQYTERRYFQVIPQEGNYIIRNVETDKYVDIFGSSTIERALIIQSNSNIYDSQKWIIEHVANGQGYVRIKSAYSGKYIGVDSSDGLSIQQYSTLDNYTLWKFERSDSGNLKLVCKALSNTLTLSPTSTSNGAYLELTTYSNDSDYCDEWVLKSNKYSFTIYHYIDDGYEIRFGSTGQDVAEYQDICSEILHELFDIEITYTVSRYYSCADICTGIPATLFDTTTACTHSNIDHKTRLKIKNDFASQFNSGSDTTAKISWTGHVLDTRSSASYSASHIIVMTIGMVTDENNSNLSTDIIRYQRIYTLLHEISHQLGAPDHYCYDENSSDCNNPTNDCWRCDNNLSSKPVCIMTSRTNDIEDRLSSGNVDTLYCSQCKSSIHSKGILTHLEDHHK